MSTKETHLRRKDRMIDPTDTKKIMETCTYAVYATSEASLYHGSWSHTL